MKNGVLYYEDSQPGHWYTFYKQDFSSSDQPELIYSSNTEITDLCIKGEFIYFSANKQLHQLHKQTYAHTVIGTMYGNSDYNGKNLRGISNWKRISASSETSDIPVEQIDAKIYPNPANDQFVIETEGKFRFKLYDSSGKMILSGMSVDKERLEVSELADGIYYIEIQKREFSHTYKIIIK